MTNSKLFIYMSVLVMTIVLYLVKAVGFFEGTRGKVSKETGSGFIGRKILISNQFIQDLKVYSTLVCSTCMTYVR